LALTAAGLRRTLLTVVACGAVLLAFGYGQRWVVNQGRLSDAADGLCKDAAGTITLVGAQSPYGKIGSCAEKDRGVPLRGPVEANITLLLTTESGLAAVRIDYSRLEVGRQYRAEAVELPAADAPGVSGATERRLRQDIAARGGVRAAKWVLHYGDG
jgi:hypothetical protein